MSNHTELTDLADEELFDENKHSSNIQHEHCDNEQSDSNVLSQDEP